MVRAKSEEYERYQLELIAADYERRGYQVSIDGQLTNETDRFDAIAFRKDDSSTVIIELVSAQRGLAQLRDRRARLERVAKSHPNATVDFRYIDFSEDPLWAKDLSKEHRVTGQLLESALALPLFDGGVISGPFDARLNYTAHFVAVWAMHSATLRAYAARLNVGQYESEEIGDLYNALLQAGGLIPPEDNTEAVVLSLPELFRLANAITQGALVSENDVMQIRLHVNSVRRQIRIRMLDIEI